VVAVSQGVRAASGGVYSAGVSAPAGSPVFSSDGGAPWNGSTAVPPANSAQGKDPQGLAEVRGRVVGGKRGWSMLGEGGHLPGPSQRATALSPSLSAARGGEGQRYRA
jgi:hypothetical protein